MRGVRLQPPESDSAQGLTVTRGVPRVVIAAVILCVASSGSPTSQAEVASLSGSVLDADGAPIARASVNLLVRPPGPWAGRLVASDFSVATDQDGRFHYVRLPPGDYLPFVSGLTLHPDPAFAYGTTFRGGGESPDDATAIRLVAGDVRDDVILAPQTHAARRIAGVVLAGGRPVGDVIVRLFDPDPTMRDFWVTTAAARSGEDGAFVINGVPAGEYDLEAVSTPLGRTTSSGRLRVSVTARDVLDLDVAIASDATITGRLVFRGASPAPAVDGRAAPVVARAVQPEFVGFLEEGIDKEVPVVSGSQFVLGPLRPGQYVIDMARGFGPWWLESATLDGRSVLGTPIGLGRADVSGLVVTFSDAPRARLEGTVADAAGRPLGVGWVVLLPADRTRWPSTSAAARMTVRSAPVATSGTWALDSIPPGRYVLFGVAPDDRAQASVGDLARRVASGVAVDLAAGASRYVDVISRREAFARGPRGSR